MKWDISLSLTVENGSGLDLGLEEEADEDAEDKYRIEVGKGPVVPARGRGAVRGLAEARRIACLYSDDLVMICLVVGVGKIKYNS